MQEMSSGTPSVLARVADVIRSSHCCRRSTPMMTRMQWRWKTFRRRRSRALVVHASDPYSKVDRTTARYTCWRHRSEREVFWKMGTRRDPNAREAFAIRLPTSWEARPSRCMTLPKYVNWSTGSIWASLMRMGILTGVLTDITFVFGMLTVRPHLDAHCINWWAASSQSFWEVVNTAASSANCVSVILQDWRCDLAVRSPTNFLPDLCRTGIPTSGQRDRQWDTTAEK